MIISRYIQGVTAKSAVLYYIVCISKGLGVGYSNPRKRTQGSRSLTILAIAWEGQGWANLFLRRGSFFIKL